jgi:N-acetyl sugar amidotransferase
MLATDRPYQQCTRCVMDTSDPFISFDNVGVCSHCRHFDRHLRSRFEAAQRGELLPAFNASMDKVRQAGKGRRYDCVLGVSGGIDSSYLAYIAKQQDLRVLLVHCDAGWNSEIAVKNIEQMVARLRFDLRTIVIDWREMQDLSRAFFKASLANCDIPQDHAFIASVYQAARAWKIPYILTGSNMATESILPAEWGYLANDAKHLFDVHRKFGERPLKNYPTLSFFDHYVRYPFILGIRMLRPLNDLPYVKAEAKDLLMRELGWQDYGGKHYESVFTKFFQSYYLVKKLGYDKRRAHLSSLILSRQMAREEALAALAVPPYDSRTIEGDIAYVTKKLGFSPQEWEAIMQLPLATYRDFASNERLFKFKNQLMGYLRNTYKDSHGA